MCPIKKVDIFAQLSAHGQLGIRTTVKWTIIRRVEMEWAKFKPEAQAQGIST